MLLSKSTRYYTGGGLHHVANTERPFNHYPFAKPPFQLYRNASRLDAIRDQRPQHLTFLLIRFPYMALPKDLRMKGQGGLRHSCTQQRCVGFFSKDILFSKRPPRDVRQTTLPTFPSEALLLISTTQVPRCGARSIQFTDQPCFAVRNVLPCDRAAMAVRRPIHCRLWSPPAGWAWAVSIH